MNSEFGGFNQAAEKTVNTASNKAMGFLAWLFNSDELKEAVDEVEATTETWTTGDLTNIASSAMAMKSTAESIGSQGAMSLYNRMPLCCWGEFFVPAADDLANFGRPLCDTRTLSTLSGFVMCDHPHIAVAGAMAAENDEIETFLTTGCYLE